MCLLFAYSTFGNKVRNICGVEMVWEPLRDVIRIW